MKNAKIACPTCSGNGFVLPKQVVTQEPGESVVMKVCPECDG